MNEEIINSEKKMLACPFCGCRPMIGVFIFDLKMEYYFISLDLLLDWEKSMREKKRISALTIRDYSVRCGRCNASRNQPKRSAYHAIKIWNDRTSFAEDVCSSN